MTKYNRSVLITDLDDTLWDWLSIWYASFMPLFNGISDISGISQSDLIPIVKSLHEAAGTSEYNFLPHGVEEHLDNPTDHKTVLNKYKAAIDSSKTNRQSFYKPFDGVQETLRTLKDRGVKIIAYTESQAFATVQRVKDFELDGIIDVLYSPEDHDFPHNLTAEQVRSMNEDHYRLLRTQHKHTPKGELKPNPRVLLDIIASESCTADECVYVGDKLVKDVSMAQEAGVLDAYAEYGNLTYTAEYEFLRKVTHWKPDAVNKEKTVQVEHAPPTITLRKNFTDIMQYVNFTPSTDS